MSPETRGEQQLSQPDLGEQRAGDLQQNVVDDEQSLLRQIEALQASRGKDQKDMATIKHLRN